MSWKDHKTPQGRAIARHLEEGIAKLIFEPIDSGVLRDLGRAAVRKASGIARSRVEVRIEPHMSTIHVWFRLRGEKDYRWLQAVVTNK